jgi:hypothetical protein
MIDQPKGWSLGPFARSTATASTEGLAGDVPNVDRAADRRPAETTRLRVGVVDNIRLAARAPSGTLRRHVRRLNATARSISAAPITGR